MRTPDAPPAQRFAALARWLSLAALAAPLAACGVDRTATASLTPEDYRQRHPIVLTQGATTLDLFVGGAGLDSASAGRVREFADGYRREGEGPVTALFPQTDVGDYRMHTTLDAIRRQLVAGGATGALNVGSYPVGDRSLAAPIRLSYVGLKAKVGSRCGEWPADLGSGSTREDWGNHPYWNHGCAYQSAFAAQVADPRDLVGPRAQAPSDVAMRTRAIGNVRQGTDPGTDWKIKNTDIGQAGGN